MNFHAAQRTTASRFHSRSNSTYHQQERAFQMEWKKYSRSIEKKIFKLHSQSAKPTTYGKQYTTQVDTPKVPYFNWAPGTPSWHTSKNRSASSLERQLSIQAEESATSKSTTSKGFFKNDSTSTRTSSSAITRKSYSEIIIVAA